MPHVTERAPGYDRDDEEPGRVKRVLLVSGGHGWSTIDVWKGMGAGFEEIGVRAIPYSLHDRIDLSGEWLKLVRKRHGNPKDEIEAHDVLYHAGARAIAMAGEQAVDAVVVLCGLLFEPRLYVVFKNYRMPVYLYGTESPYDDDMFSAVGHLAAACSTNERTSLERLKNTIQAKRPDVPVVYNPIGYNPRLHRPGANQEAKRVTAHDVVFVGNLYPSRIAMLEAVDWSGIDLGLYGVFRFLPDDHPLQRYRSGDVVVNEVTTALHTRAKIVVNLFRSEQFRDGWDTVNQVDGGESLNPRLVEAAACGCCVISEWRPEVEERFGDALPTFRTPQELEALVRRLLASPEERDKIASRLPALVTDLSYAERARDIVRILEGLPRTA